MIEVVWSCLLGLSVLDRKARPVALFFLLTWLANYAAFWSEIYRLPVLVDIVSGLIVARMISDLPRVRRNVIAVALVLAPLNHGLYWLISDAGYSTYDLRSSYYTLCALIFTAKASALAWPGVTHFVGIISDVAGRAARFWLDRISPVPRQRAGPAR